MCVLFRYLEYFLSYAILLHIICEMNTFISVGVASKHFKWCRFLSPLFSLSMVSEENMWTRWRDGVGCQVSHRQVSKIFTIL